MVLGVRLANIPIALSSEPQYGLFLEKRYTGFLEDAETAALRVALSFSGDWWARRADAATWRTRARPWGFALRGPGLRASVNLRKGCGWVASSHPLAADVVLRLALPYLLAPGVMLHGACLLFPWGALGACGPSGAGKSTLTALAGERALCDELFAVVPEERNGPTAHSLPYWVARSGSGPLRAVLHLRHGAKPSLERLAPAEAFRQLLAQATLPAADRGKVLPVLRFLGVLVGAVPQFQFVFPPTSEAVAFLEAFFADGAGRTGGRDA